MLSRALLALCTCWAVLGGAGSVQGAHPKDIRTDLVFSANPSSLLPLSASSGLPPLAGATPLIQDFLLASQKLRIAERQLAVGNDEEAVRLFAESLAELIGVQKSSPNFAPEVLSAKIVEVKRALQRSLEP